MNIRFLNTFTAGKTVLAAAVSVFLVAACSDHPNHISLALLAAEQHRVDGQYVRTEGVVRYFEDPLHYWIEDDMLNRVAIHPQHKVVDKVGQKIEVTGRFYADRERGRRIEVEQVRVLDTDAS